MNALKKIVAMLMFLFAGFAAAEQVLVQGAELKGLVMTEQGSTWTLSNGSRLTFLPNMTLVDCTGKPGWETCDDGTYVLTDNSIERKYNTWFKEAGGARKAVVKKDGDKLVFNGFDVVKYSMTPTLLPATSEQIMSLSGKDFKQNYHDDGLQPMNFSKDMVLHSCSKSGCSRTLPLKVTAPRVEWSTLGIPGASLAGESGTTLMAVEGGALLWGGRKLFPQ